VGQRLFVQLQTKVYLLILRCAFGVKAKFYSMYINACFRQTTETWLGGLLVERRTSVSQIRQVAAV